MKQSHTPFSAYPDLLTFKEMCDLLGLGKNTAYKLLNDKTIPSLKLGREYRIPKIYVLRFIKNEVKANTKSN
ncbi:helix-turn-helix domain-containing protein [Carnobacterium gallinarum]|uniref:helix-turn-helix domain-containing protein n=1 Tax=Carnobacterium gallinarum TaxID=2749 RepID=UPI0005591C3A